MTARAICRTVAMTALVLVGAACASERTTTSPSAATSPSTAPTRSSAPIQQTPVTPSSASATSPASVASATTKPSSSTASNVTEPASPRPATTAPPKAPADDTAPASSPGVELTEADNNTHVSARIGQPVTLVLHSTYWTVHDSSNAAVLRADAPPVTQPEPGCVPGQGCGTVTAAFTAVATGDAALTASRTSCGEAAGCTAAASQFQVTVTVT